MPDRKHIDLITGLLFTILGIFLLFIIIPYGIVEPAKVKFAALSPSYYPRLIAYALILFGLLILGFSLFKPKIENKASNGDFIDDTKPINILIVLIILSLFYIFLEHLGFVLGAIIALILLLFLAGERKPHTILLISLIVPLTLYFFFTKVANIPIPTGILETILVGG